MLTGAAASIELDQLSLYQHSISIEQVCNTGRYLDNNRLVITVFLADSQLGQIELLQHCRAIESPAGVSCKLARNSAPEWTPYLWPDNYSCRAIAITTGPQLWELARS